jgi:hypothetical protein
MLKIIDAAKGDLMRYKANAKIQTKSIHHSCEVLRARKNALRAKMMGYSQREDSINEERVAVGLKPIGADIDWSGCATGSRDARTGFPAGTGVSARKRRHDDDEGGVLHAGARPMLDST